MNLREKLLAEREIDDREQAEAYARQPERFTLLSFDVQIETESGKELILYSDGDWSCTCIIFETQKNCSHVMAASLLLKGLLL